MAAKAERFASTVLWRSMILGTTITCFVEIDDSWNHHNASSAVMGLLEGEQPCCSVVAYSALQLFAELAGEVAWL